MSISPLPAALQQLGGRRFSFYPPILNVERNEWMYRRATWSDVVVVNTSSGEEACIPRMFVGEASRIDEPIVIVGLRRELEWREGLVVPHRRPVVELPIAVNEGRASTPRQHGLAPVVNIRLEPRPELRVSRKIGVAVMLGALGCLILADIGHQIQMRQRAGAIRQSRAYMDLGPSDDYDAIVRKLGPPASDREFVSETGVYRTLLYPKLQFKAVLAGVTGGNSRYIGAIDWQGRILDSVKYPDGSTAHAQLRSLPHF